MVSSSSTVLARLLSSLLLSLVVAALLKCQYHLLYQPLFLSFSYVSCCFMSIYPTTVFCFFLKYHNGNKVTQPFCVIPAIAPYRELFCHNFNEFIFVYVVNTRFICHGEIYFLTYLLISHYLETFFQF